MCKKKKSERKIASFRRIFHADVVRQHRGRTSRDGAYENSVNKGAVSNSRPIDDFFFFCCLIFFYFIIMTIIKENVGLTSASRKKKEPWQRWWSGVDGQESAQNRTTAVSNEKLINEEAVAAVVYRQRKDLFLHDRLLPDDDLILGLF